ncbi:putative AC9 transposase, partial [Bienertia sinuspersici]
SSKFPVLARIARDILAIPASTIASESAFSAGKRVLDEKRYRLSFESIEMSVCKKDWDQAEKGTQGLKEEEEDEDDPWMTIDTSDSDGSGDGGNQQQQQQAP